MTTGKFSRASFIALAILSIFSSLVADAQLPASMTFINSSALQGANRMNDEFVNVGAFKVKGNSYVLKGANKSDIYTNLGFAADMPLVYDANTQTVSVLQEDHSKVVDIKLDQLDSFSVKLTNDDIAVVSAPAFFVNASRYEPSKKYYLQRLTNGSKFNLYKLYKTELRPAALDLAQTSLREFEITPEYYYMDMSTRKEFVRIRKEGTLKKDFKDNAAALQALSVDAKTELKYVRFFDALNK
ncbi:hypothetical protein EGI32_20350 [Ferruginibacter sp. HRS2-29]|nr:hypothetical protein [Ferruginibacter sp. HRS2-29]